MAALPEQEILNIVYSLYETDDENWDTTSSEYLSARVFANDAINKWRGYKNTEWKTLWTNLDDAADGDKTTTAGDYSYDCPTNFLKPSSWVRTEDSGGGFTLWKVISPHKIANLDTNEEYFCYFTGSEKTGFDLHFNPNKDLTTGDTIHYEYYKTPTKFTATTSTTEVPDPYFIVYYVVYRLLKNDGEDYREEKEQWMSLLDNMETENMSGLFDISDPFTESSELVGGFGE